MKASPGAVTMAAAAMISPAAAQQQQQPGVLPACGQTCMQNMIAQGPAVLGCPASDASCLCGNPNFGYGVRDCAMQACTPIDAQAVIVYGLNYCAGALPVRPPPPQTASSAITTATLPPKTLDKPTPSSTGTPSTAPYTVLEIDSIYTDAQGAVHISTLISTQGAAVAVAAPSVAQEGAAQQTGGSTNGDNNNDNTQDGPDQNGDGDGNEYASTTHKKEPQSSSETATKTVSSSSSDAGGGGAFAAMRTMDVLALRILGVAVGVLM